MGYCRTALIPALATSVVLLALILVPNYPVVADGKVYDWGDAPESYGTLAADDGARHALSSLYLGDGIDDETDGIPDDFAVGDDEDASDDEDGIWFDSFMWPGGHGNIHVSTSEAGFIDAWVDFNRDGDWNDTGEKVWDSVSISAGWHDHFHQFTVPADAVPGPTYARFRLSSTGGLDPYGAAPDGEVEDYITVITESDTVWDWGDAPAPYSGTPGYMGLCACLGRWVDGETGDQPSADALGDDLNGAMDDEDGVLFKTPLIPGEEATVEISLITQGQGCDLPVYASFDWNQDGDWNDAGESLGFVGSFETGRHDVTIDVPASALPGETYARFTLSGGVFQGEVEDYRVFVGQDWGDAPESYGTLAADNGPRHAPGSLYLGDATDGEPDGLPGDFAVGDDEDATDDEDGIWFNHFMRPGGQSGIHVRTSEAGFIDAWVDFNRDGDWDDAGEKVWNSVSISAGWHDHFHPFTVPADAVPGPTYARFRLSSTGGLDPYGAALDGEVEDYITVIKESEPVYDYGDAPAPYPGMKCYAWESCLGAWVDGESGDQPSADALGDDLNGAMDDEDGVLFKTPLIPGEEATVEISLITQGQGCDLPVYASFDWNQDGDWNDAGESLGFVGSFETGRHDVTIDVPASALSGQTYARFTVGDMMTGGEVEDYRVFVGDELTLHLKTGWNMVSVPLDLADNRQSVVFPTAKVDAVYTWNPGSKCYVVPGDTPGIQPERGYWVAVSEDTLLTLTGTPVCGWEDSDIHEGWNMSGSTFVTQCCFAEPCDCPDGSVEGFAYTWDPASKSYSYCTTIEPGKGYWVAATSDCSLTMGAPPSP